MTDKQYVAGSLIHSTILVPDFKILSQVVPEKSLMEKSKKGRQTDRQTNLTSKLKKTKTVYSLYIYAYILRIPGGGGYKYYQS